MKLISTKSGRTNLKHNWWKYGDVSNKCISKYPSVPGSLPLPYIPDGR